MLLFSQGLCANRIENTVIFLCETTTVNLYWWLLNLHELPVIMGRSTSVRSSMPSKLVFLPVASPVACTFSIILLVGSKLLNREVSLCLTWSQMASADLVAHAQIMHAYTRNYIIITTNPPLVRNML